MAVKLSRFFHSTSGMVAVSSTRRLASTLSFPPYVEAVARLRKNVRQSLRLLVTHGRLRFQCLLAVSNLVNGSCRSKPSTDQHQHEVTRHPPGQGALTRLVQTISADFAASAPREWIRDPETTKELVDLWLRYENIPFLEPSLTPAA